MRLAKCFFVSFCFLFILAACSHSPFFEMKAESVCPKDELNEGAVNRVGQSERNAVRDPRSRVKARLSSVQVGGGVEEEVQDLQNLI